MKTKLLFFAILLAVILILGCQTSGNRKEGFYIDLIEGAGFVSSGKTLLEGEPFRIGLKLVNYDEKEKKGYICVYDNMNDYYGGIQKECKQFYVTGSSKTEKTEVPGETKIYFPSSGYYSYNNLQTDFGPEIYIEMEYIQDSIFSTALNYPIPETESFSFSDKFINIKVEKSVHQSENGYEIFLDLSVRKKNNVSVLFGGKDNSISLTIEAEPLTFSCQTQEKQFSKSIILDVERENFIRCSALTTSTQEESLPFLISLNYKAKEIEKIKFNVKKRG